MGKKFVLFALIPLALAVLYNACGNVKVKTQETVIGTPVVSLNFKSYENPGNFSELRFCLKQLDLKKSQGGEIVSVPLEAIETLAVPEGQRLTGVDLPAGDFSEVKIVLSKTCASSKSLIFKNLQGEFEGGDNIKLTFTGEMSVTKVAAILSFDIQPLVNTLAGVAQTSEVRPKAEAVVSTFVYTNKSTRTWTGASADSRWSNPANWQGNVIPSETEVAVFDSTCEPNCSVSIDMNIFVAGIEMRADYSSIVTQLPIWPMHVLGDFDQYGGKFQGGDADSVFYGNLHLWGGESFVSTASNLYVGGDFVQDLPIFDNNRGQVIFSGARQNLRSSTLLNFWKLGFATISSYVTVSSDIYVGSDINIGKFHRGLRGGKNISVRGDVLFDPSGTGTLASSDSHDAKIIFMGDIGQYVIGYAVAYDDGGNSLPSVEIAKPNDPYEPLNLRSTFAIFGNFTYTSGTVIPWTGNVLFKHLESITIDSKGMPFWDVTIAGMGANQTVNIATPMTVNNFSYQSVAGGNQLNGALISVGGDCRLDSAAGSVSIEMVGGASQLLTANTPVGFTGTFEIRKNNPTELVTLSTNITLSNLRITLGTLMQSGLNLDVTGALANAGTINQGGGLLTYGSLTGTGVINP